MTVNPHHPQTHRYDAGFKPNEGMQGGSSAVINPSPQAKRYKQPSWVQPRLVIGLLLVSVSVFLGARVVASADERVNIWVVTSYLASGTVIKGSDVHTSKVHLAQITKNYVDARDSPVGKTLTRDVGDGELLPMNALRERVCGSLLTIPVTTNHMPDSLSKGDRIDLYSTPTDGETSQILDGAAVQAVKRPDNELLATNAQWTVSVRVRSTVAHTVIQAANETAVDVAVVSEQGVDSNPCDSVENT